MPRVAVAPQPAEEIARPQLAAAFGQLDLQSHVLAVHAQLIPIHSRSALLDSYRRESLNLLPPRAEALDAAAAALEIAYTRRWQELADMPEAPSTEPTAWQELEGWL